MNKQRTDLTESLPSAAEVRARLRENLREATLLRRLLRLADAAEKNRAEMSHAPGVRL